MTSIRPASSSRCRTAPGCTWQQLPSASFGPSGATAHRRFTEWSKASVWAKFHRLVAFSSIACTLICYRRLTNSDDGPARF
ncbi:transposase [Streptomyces antimycoticus]|uniref:transposase n=1 Tax=Streptomyces antimycoticus TaxID=68175 RepID=UPI0036E28676